MLDRTNLAIAALSLAAVSTLVSIAAVALAVKAQASRDEISVRRIAIVDDDGKERVILGTINAVTGLDGDKGAYVQLLNDKRAPVAGIVSRQRATTGLSESMLSLCDDNGNVVASLEAGEVADTSRTPRLWMDGGVGDYSQLVLGISTGDSLKTGMPANVAVPAAGHPLFVMVGPNHEVVAREP